MQKFFLLLVVSCFMVSNVSYSQSPKKKLIPRTDLLKKYDLIPVDKLYKAKDFSLKKYKKIMIKAVYTENDVKNSQLKNKKNVSWLSKEDKETRAFANYTKKAFENAIKKDPKWELATSPGPDTLTLELMLIDIVPGKPIVGVARNIPVGFVLGKGPAIVTTAVTGARMLSQSNKKTSTFLDASVGIEGIIRDSLTNKIVVMVQDHETQKAALFNAKDFTEYGNLEQIVNEWAELLIECLNKRPLETGKKVNKKSKLKLLN